MEKKPKKKKNIDQIKYQKQRETINYLVYYLLHSPKKREQKTMSGNLSCVIVAVDGSEESMNALRWALDNLQLRSPTDDSTTAAGSFVVLHVQSPPSIAAGLNPGSIPFGGPS